MGQNTSTAILANEQWGSPRSGTVAQFRCTGCCQWGTWGGTQAQQFWLINNVAPTDQAECHNLDIPDFIGGAHGPARRLRPVGLAKSSTVAKFRLS